MPGPGLRGACYGISTAGRTLPQQAAADHPGLRKAWVDGGCRKHFVEHAAGLGIDLEIIRRTPGARGFTTGESTISWLDPASACQSRRYR
ncbi:hypothetical protein [Streptomyces sp. NBC_00989]|uniref:hypothetical protein n=1 Tax=Streptomyces sp. NBC_00989 TaxID=2903705 RepID=UPI00386A68B1|nr:hypothetical protein OG714_02075 [Streptomyces sp. NBC_00989]